MSLQTCYVDRTQVIVKDEVVLDTGLYRPLLKLYATFLDFFVCDSRSEPACNLPSLHCRRLGAIWRLQDTNVLLFLYLSFACICDEGISSGSSF
jgi:hypothetical protein